MKTPNKTSAPTTAPTTVAALLLMLVPLPYYRAAWFSWSSKILTATVRSKRVSCARHTSPMPPSPILAVTAYGPRVVPGVRDILFS